jgi:hypothetical protein
MGRHGRDHPIVFAGGGEQQSAKDFEKNGRSGFRRRRHLVGGSRMEEWEDMAQSVACPLVEAPRMAVGKCIEPGRLMNTK